MNDFYPTGNSSLPGETDYRGRDWKDRELYRGDEVYKTEFGDVRKDDIEELMNHIYGFSQELQ